VSGDRSRRVVVVLTLLTTIAAAVVAGLQVEADTQADAANRESELLVLNATSKQISDAYLENYETALVTRVLGDTQESLTLDFAALQQSMTGDDAGSSQLTAQAASKRARATQARALSDIYQDPLLAPASETSLPDVASYFRTRNDVTQEMVDRQNAASDAYNAWGSRSNTYVAILSVLAVTFFLLGMAQIGRRMRPFLATCAGALMVISIAWAAATAFT
jgi:hypothetical protein